MLDSSALVALLIDAGRDGQWVSDAVEGAVLAAPDLVLVEAANILRRRELAGAIDPTEASLAHEDLLALSVQLWPYPPLADRVWQLRANITCYDAAFVAVAELLGASLVTLDARLARAPGPRCPVVVRP